MLEVRFFKNPRFTAASTTVTLVFFALFGFIFLATQYLQFVLGYSPFEAGVRTLPFAVGDDRSRRRRRRSWCERFGTKRVVVTGMLLFASGLVVASTSTVTRATTASLSPCCSWARGMGLRGRAGDGVDHGLVALHKAGVGSAVNDTRP